MPYPIIKIKLKLKTMLVDTMTPEEKIIELEIDYHNFGLLMINQVSKQYARERKERKIYKALTYPISYTFMSPSKNYWTYIMKKGDSAKRYEDHLDTSFVIYTHYINEKGFQVFTPESEHGEIASVDCYNNMFFYGYAEKMNLDFSSPLEIVGKFFVNNPRMTVKAQNNDILIGTCKDGLALGNIGNDLYPVYNNFKLNPTTVL